MTAPHGSGRRRAALVTGSARRIGRAIALALAEAGFAVAVHCNASREAADEVATEIVSRGGRAGVVAADLGDPMEVERLVPAAAAAVGPITLLVNSAAEFLHDGIGSLRREVFDRQLAVNLRAPLFWRRPSPRRCRRTPTIPRS